MKNKVWRSLFLSIAFICIQNGLLNAAMPPRYSLTTYALNGNPLFNFDIAIGSGENYADNANPSGDEFFWTLTPQHIDSIKNASDYWASLLGSIPQNSQAVKISMGIYNYLNDDAISDYAASGAGMTVLASALLHNNTSDHYIGANPNYTQNAYAQIRIGALSFPFLDYMGQSFEDIEYIWADTSAWSFKPMELLPNNSLMDGMVPVIIHEIGHAMGIMSFEYFKSDGKLYFLEYDGTNLNRFDQNLYDSFGVAASANQIVRLADSSEGGSTDFKIIRKGDPSLNDGEIGGFAFFQGSNVMSVLGGAIHKTNNPNNIGGLPINGFEGEDSDLSHLELRNSMMSHQNYRNWNTLMEAELALLQDIGIDLDRKNIYGRSVYQDNISYLSIADNFYKRNPAGSAYLNGQYNNTPYTIGIHIYGTTNTIEMRGEILSNGQASAGIRIDGWNNKLTIADVGNIHSDGQNSAALMVSYGKDHKIIHKGILSAIGSGGIGARFDFGDNILGDMYEYRGSYMRRHANFDPNASVNPYWNPFYWNMDDLLPELQGALVEKFDISGSVRGSKAAIYISPNAFVKEINIMNGAQITGDIISDWSPSFDFNQITDIFHFVQYYWFAGWYLNGQPVMTMGDLNDLKTKLTFGHRKDANGEKTSQIDDDFNLNYSGNIKAGGGYSMSIVLAGGHLTFSGSISGVSDINKTSIGLFTMSGDGSSFNGVFNQSAGTTTFLLGSKMFKGENNIFGGVLNVNAADPNYKANIGGAKLNHYNTESSQFKTINRSIQFSAIGGQALFTSLSPSQYKARYTLSAKIDNGNPNAVFFKDAVVKFSISDFRSGGATTYHFENSVMDLRTASTRTISFPSIEVSASSLSVSLFYNSHRVSADSLETNGNGKFYFGDISILPSAAMAGEYQTKIFTGGAVQFYAYQDRTLEIGKYIYQIESSSWTGSSFDGGYFWLKTRISIVDFLLKLNAQSGTRVFDMSSADIKEYGRPYFISEPLGASAMGDFKVIGDKNYSPNSLENTISGLIVNGGGVKGSFFDLSPNSALTLENVAISDAYSTNGSVILSQNSNVLTVFKDIILQSNTAQKGGAVYISNGAIIKTQSGSYGDSFIGNTASDEGGVFYIDRSTIEFESSLKFIDNSAGNFGGAVYMSGDLSNPSYVFIKTKQGNSVLFNGNKDGSKSNDIYMEKFSNLILDADGADIIMNGGISAPDDNNFIYKTGDSLFALGGVVDFQGEFKIVRGGVSFLENSKINIKDLIIGSQSAGSGRISFLASQPQSAAVEVFTSSVNTDSLLINANGIFSMSDKKIRKQLSVIGIFEIFGTLDIAIDASSGSLGISDIITAGQIKIETGSVLKVQSYGIGRIEALLFDSYNVSNANLWQSGEIYSTASKGLWTITNSGNLYTIHSNIQSNLSAIAGLSPIQQGFANFLDLIPNDAPLIQEIIDPFTRMDDIKDIKRGINQLSGLIYYKTALIGAMDNMTDIIYSNISVESSSSVKKTKKKDKRYQFIFISDDAFFDDIILDDSKKNKQPQKEIKNKNIIKNSTWFNFNYSNSAYKNDFDEKDFNLGGFGFWAGSPLFLGGESLLGVYAGIDLKNAKEDLEKADIKDFRLGLYGAYSLSDALIKTNLGFGIQDFSVKRVIDYAVDYGQDEINPKSNWTAYSINLSAQLQFASLSNSIELSPYAGFSSGISINPEISEENAQGRELIIKRALYTRLAPNAGLSLNIPMESFRLNIKAGISYVILGDEIKREAAFKEFSQYGSIDNITIKTDSLLCQFATALYYDIDDFSIGLNFGADISENVLSYILNFGANIKFK
ncbi:MAG: autotransporter outer membrane beta-barrel domain-containing protein [Elusimicrobiota bacterium]|nr:autotransporter outer membrane beta-barrel domain-containing protein [Elusimicrobiota bacterium]